MRFRCTHGFRSKLKFSAPRTLDSNSLKTDSLQVENLTGQYGPTVVHAWEMSPATAAGGSPRKRSHPTLSAFAAPRLVLSRGCAPGVQKTATSPFQRPGTTIRRNRPFMKCACQICTCTLFEEREVRRYLQYGGFSVWHPDCGNALRQLTETHQQQHVPGPR